MRNNIQPIIQRIGETDQIYLNGNTPELALERADLRLQLVTLSQFRQEQIHFLQEAIVILERARIEFDEMPVEMYLKLSLHLAKAYMIYYEISKDQKFAIITQQILKPITTDLNGEVYFFLAYASAVKNEHSLTRHWLGKYLKTKEFDFDLFNIHPAFDQYRKLDWFLNLLKSKMH